MVDNERKEWVDAHYNQMELTRPPEKPKEALRKTDIENGVETGHIDEFTSRKHNGVWMISNEFTGDIGAEINRILDLADPGSIIEIGPGTYDCYTTAIIDQETTIRSKAIPHSPRRERALTIRLHNEDTPFVRVQNQGWRSQFRGLHIEAATEGLSTNGMVFHQRVAVERCSIKNIGGIGLYFHQAPSTADRTEGNLNESQVRWVTGHSLGSDMIRLTNTTSNQSDLNACRMHVARYSGTGWAINSGEGSTSQSSFGNTYRVDYCEGSDIVGAIRILGNSCRGEIGYLEGPQHAVEFRSGSHYNTVEIGFTEFVDAVVVRNGDQDSANQIIRRGLNQFGEGTRWDRSRKLGGQDLLFSEAGRGPVVKSPDGTVAKRIRIDNSGNIVTDDLDATQF